MLAKNIFVATTAKENIFCAGPLSDLHYWFCYCSDLIIVFPSFYLWSLLLVYLVRYLPVEAAMPSFIIINSDTSCYVIGCVNNGIIIAADEFSF